MTVSAEVVALIAAAVAVLAAVLAVRAAALAARAVLAEPSSAKLPAFRILEGHTRRDIGTDTHDYVFVIAASNAMAMEWRCDAPTLRVTYRTRANFLGAVDLPSSEPLVAPGGQTTKATLRFTTSNVIPRHCRIDAYTLLFVDERGERLTVDASLPAVLQADSDGTGPSTWGWD
jgi:hypothetical protein